MTDCKFWPHEPVAPEDISGQFPRPPSPSSQIQPLLKFDLSEPVANFCPIHPHTPSSEQPLSPLPPLNPVLNVGSISCSNLFIHSAINKLCALHGSKQTSLLSWRVTLATESQETNNICGVLTGGIKRGGRECWEAVCVCVCVCVRACARTCSVTQLSHSVLSDTFAAPWIVACQDPLIYGIFRARILDWIAISTSRGSSQPSDSLPLSHPWCVGVGGIEKSESVWGLRF